MNSTAHWTVPLDHPAFAGHFPGTPILPGVVLLDMTLHAISEAIGKAPGTCEISSVKFLSPARPGDRLEIQHRYAANHAIHFAIVAGPRTIATGSITIAGMMTIAAAVPQ
jgi:3-hydroxymyristoyl/3-hydroxydecanoyl-(acyl carrier protein) dehydratase